MRCAFDGTSPSLDAFDAVIHLNGDTYDNDMDEAGQQALLGFVVAGGVDAAGCGCQRARGGSGLAFAVGAVALAGLGRRRRAERAG